MKLCKVLVEGMRINRQTIKLKIASSLDRTLKSAKNSSGNFKQKKMRTFFKHEPCSYYLWKIIIMIFIFIEVSDSWVNNIYKNEHFCRYFQDSVIRTQYYAHLFYQTSSVALILS